MTEGEPAKHRCCPQNIDLINVYTDRSYCHAVVGIAYIINDAPCVSSWQIASPDTVELLPVLHALRAIEKPSIVVLHSDCHAVGGLDQRKMRDWKPKWLFRFIHKLAAPHDLTVKMVSRNTAQIQLCHNASRAAANKGAFARTEMVNQLTKSRPKRAVPAKRPSLREVLKDFCVSGDVWGHARTDQHRILTRLS